MSFHAGAHPMTSALYENPSLTRSSSVSSKPRPTSLRPQSQTTVSSRVVSPSEKSRDSSFDFSVPSLPPRLANFGRKISQMRDDFIDSLDDTPETKRKSLDSARGGVKPLSSTHEHGHSDVPGMGDDPVMCPFCNKPLPPVLFHQPSPKKPSRPSMRRPATSAGAASPFGLSSTAPATRTNSITLDSPPVKPLSSLPSSSASGQLLDAAEVKPRPKPLRDITKGGLASEIMRSPDPAVTSESLRPQVMDADKLNHAAAEINISEEDIRRWSTLAGVTLPPVERPSSAPPTTTTTGDASSPTNKVAKPPPDQGISPGGRFGFFRKTSGRANTPKAGDESDEEGGGGPGYSKLLDTGSEDEDDTIHEEPKAMTDGDETPEDTTETLKSEAKVNDTAALPVKEVAKGDDELRIVLQEVLLKISEISKSHNALLTSQSTLLTSLKIARSNLAMAEANTEMLEAQIKQVKGSTPRSTIAGPGTPSTAPTSRAVSATSTSPVDKTTPRASEKATPKASERNSTERTRPLSLHTSLSDGTTANGEKSGWGGGFWNGGKRRLAGLSESMSGLSTPTGEKSGFDFMSVAAAGPYAFAPSHGLDDRRSSTGKSASVDDLVPGGPVTGGPTREANTEVGRLRQAYTTAQTRMETMSKELVELKKGKVEMEAELENLSQALFEEANKMVADERRKRAEMEEALKEVKAEKDALRSTIKVLGGGGEDDAQSTVSTETTDTGSFEPRDLDKHYEALRRSIHHVADGTEGVTLSPLSPLQPMPTLAEGTETSAAMGHCNSDPGVISSPETSLDLPTARNSIERKAEEGSIPDIKPIASNPELEAAVDVPEPIPEDQPINHHSSPMDRTRDPSEEDLTAGAAGRVVLEAEQNPWDDATPQNGPTTTNKSGESDMSASSDVGLKGKEVEQLDRLMQRLKNEELGNVVPMA